MKLKLFGYDITISYYFGAMIPIALLLDATGTALWGMFAAAVHELGHLWMMHLLKCPKCQIRITVFGIQMVQEEYGGYGFRRDCLISIAGPFINLFFLRCFPRWETRCPKAICKMHLPFLSLPSVFSIFFRFIHWMEGRYCTPFSAQNFLCARLTGQFVLYRSFFCCR